MSLPILYSFRRCPYAMRARLSLAYAGISYEHREILLKDRPEALYHLSAKGTVPVLQLTDQTVIDESMAVMKWALQKNDPDHWYTNRIDEQDALILRNDGEFKERLDRYKYHIRFPKESFETYQDNISDILSEYDLVLSSSSYLLGGQVSLADMALFPFIRQCAHVDLNWFISQFKYLAEWLEAFKESSLFGSIMTKYDVWEDGNKGVLVQWV